MANTKKANQTLAAEPQQQEQTAPAGVPPVDGLTIQDLSTALQIISVVQARGAIKAEEMVVVGSLYSKLHSFLEASGALAQEQGALPAEAPAKPAAPEETVGS